MTAYWCELAWVGDPAAPVEHGVLIETAGDRIVRVSAVPAPPSGTEVLRGLTMPGIANAHSHAFHRAFRGRTHGGTGTFWNWREQMYAVAARLTPDSYLALATAVYAEMVQAGFTAVGEFHYVHHRADGRPYTDSNEMSGVLIEAARRAGIRLALLDTCYLQGGIDDLGNALDVNDVQRRFADRSADAWVQRVDTMPTDLGPTVRIGAAIHSVRAVDPASAAIVAAWAAEHGAIVHAHVSEQPLENEQSLAAYGRTPTQVLHDAGAVSERFTSVHATHLTNRDIELMGTRGCLCCMCPTTERDLADGIAPTMRMREAGVELCIGTDAHSSIDPFEEVRAVETDERLRSLRRGNHQPTDLMRMACAHGYRSLGWIDGGRIEPGALADFVTVDLATPRLAGTQPKDSLAAAVFAASASDVSSVIVGGSRIVAEGRHLTLDVAPMLASSISALFD